MEATVSSPFVVNLAAVAMSESGLTRIPLAALGSYVWKGQKLSLTPKDFAEIRTNFAKRENGEVVIDYEHGQLNPMLAGGGGPVPASGWLKEIDPETDADGILWGRCEFTDRARAMIAAGEYRFLSPVIEWGARDKHTGAPQGATLSSMALVNRPFIEKLPAIALSEGWSKEEEKPMVKRVVLADRAAGTVRAFFEDGAEGVFTVEGLDAPPRVVALSEVQRGNDGRYDFGSLPLNEGVLIAGEVFRAMRAQQALDTATGKGLITPAQRPFYERMALSDLAGFEALVATMKPQVAMGEAGLAGDGSEATEQEKVEAQIEEKVKAKTSAGIAHGQALRLVASENPELWERRQRLLRRLVRTEEDA
jgi:hypothetical protein